MAKIPKRAPLDEAEVEYVEPDKLRFDSHNPRLVEFLEENKKPSQDELLQVLWDEMAVDELVMSIAKSGYMPYEPLLVAKEGGELVVIEGNRRLAAVLLLLNSGLRSKVKAVDLPKLSAV